VHKTRRNKERNRKKRARRKNRPEVVTSFPHTIRRQMGTELVLSGPALEECYAQFAEIHRPMWYFSPTFGEGYAPQRRKARHG
jgi:hypothetical protein